MTNKTDVELFKEELIQFKKDLGLTSLEMAYILEIKHKTIQNLLTRGSHSQRQRNFITNKLKRIKLDSKNYLAILSNFKQSDHETNSLQSL